jgi:hypothetical protein
MIAFDELPKRLLAGIRKRDESATRGLREFLKSNKCLDKRITQWKNPETGQIEMIESFYPFTYQLEPKTINADGEKWQEIESYVRRVVDPNVRLMDRIENMAIDMAVDSYSEMNLEPENIPVIPIRPEIVSPKSVPVYEAPIVEKAEKEAEKVVVEEIKKKRGRPRKILEVAGNAQ